VHAAGLLEDGALLQQRWPRFAAPLGPKVDGSWTLHALTRGMRLDFFVMYSSLASVLGSSGQGNHAAANSFMDALAVQRRSDGLPAVSIAWGAWSEVGAAADRQLAQRIDARGLEPITSSRGLALLETVMGADLAHVAVFPVRWTDFMAQPQASWPMCFDLRPSARSAPATASSPAPAGPSAMLIDQLTEASPSRRQELLLGLVGAHVARVIGASGGEAIDPRQPLNELGLDSLMAVELRNRLGTVLGLARSLPATLVFDHPTIEALSTYLACHVIAANDVAPPQTTAAIVVPADAVGAIDELSDTEVEHLFARKMLRS
jgi:hypothetical protein